MSGDEIERWGAWAGAWGLMRGHKREREASSLKRQKARYAKRLVERADILRHPAHSCFRTLVVIIFLKLEHVCHLKSALKYPKITITLKYDLVHLLSVC